MTNEAEQVSTAAITVKLRRDKFARVCAERGLKTTEAIAATINLSEKTVTRVTEKGDDPSGRFIGRTLAAWPDFSFRTLFAVIDETTGEEVR